MPILNEDKNNHLIRGLDHILNQFIDYFKNNARPAHKKLPGFEAQFTKLFDERVRKDLSALQVDNIYLILSKYQTAFLESRSRNFEIAKQYIVEGTQLLQTVPPRCRAMVHFQSLPIIAYYLYKLELFQEAVNKLIEAIEVDETLELNNFSFLHIHKIQLLQNISRVYLKMGATKRGAKLISDILNYLINSVSFMGYGKLWGADFLNNVSIELKQQMTTQIIGEMVSFLLKKTNTGSINEEKIFKLTFDGLFRYSDSFNNMNPFLSNIKHWVSASNQYYNKDYITFLVSAQDFLKKRDQNVFELNIFLLKKIVLIGVQINYQHIAALKGVFIQYSNQ